MKKRFSLILALVLIVVLLAGCGGANGYPAAGGMYNSKEDTMPSSAAAPGGYGGYYDESIADVMSGRLDVIGGIGFTVSRRDKFRYPHTPMGMLRVYLWARPDSPYKPGEPETWSGMKVGLLASTVSAQRARRQFGGDESI